MQREEAAQRDKLERLNSMFATDAWDDFVELVSDSQELLQDVRRVNKVEELFFAKGQLQKLDEITNLPGFVRSQLEELDAI